MSKEKEYYPDKRETPLDQWTENVDPVLMSGQHWEREGHRPEELDIGWESRENKDLLQDRIPQGGRFMHPVHDVSYDMSTDRSAVTEEEESIE